MFIYDTYPLSSGIAHIQDRLWSSQREKESTAERCFPGLSAYLKRSCANW